MSRPGEKMSDEQTLKPTLLSREYVHDGFAGATLRWGEYITIQDRIREIQQGFANKGLPIPSLEMDLGVDQLYVNRLPEQEADNKGIQIMATALQQTMDRLGWEPESVRGIFIGSSLAPLAGSTYPQIFKDELKLKNAKPYYVHAACTSGGLALIKALSDKDLKGERVLVGANEVMLRRSMVYDPAVMDQGSGLIFSQGGTVMGIVSDETIKLKGDYVFFEEPDTRLFLAADTNYQTNPSNEGSIVEETEAGIKVQLPIPQDGRLISMNYRVGGLFGRDAKKATVNTKKSMSITEWNSIVAMAMHFPNKLIGAHVVRMMLEDEFMPEGILSGMTKEQALEILDEKGKGLTALPLKIYPKENLYGNAPAANALMALIENWGNLKGIGDIFTLFFGAGATYLGARVEIP